MSLKEWRGIMRSRCFTIVLLVKYTGSTAIELRSKLCSAAQVVSLMLSLFSMYLSHRVRTYSLRPIMNSHFYRWRLSGTSPGLDYWQCICGDKGWSRSCLQSKNYWTAEMLLRAKQSRGSEWNCSASE